MGHLRVPPTSAPGSYRQSGVTVKVLCSLDAKQLCHTENLAEWTHSMTSLTTPDRVLFKQLCQLCVNLFKLQNKSPYLQVERIRRDKWVHIICATFFCAISHLRDISIARHPICATFQMRDTSIARYPICATFHMRDFSIARHPICATSHLSDNPFARLFSSLFESLDELV